MNNVVVGELDVTSVDTTVIVVAVTSMRDTARLLHEPIGSGRDGGCKEHQSVFLVILVYAHRLMREGFDYVKQVRLRYLM